MLPTGLLISLHAYECVTVPVYLRIIYVLIKDKQFKNPFWHIFCLASLIVSVGFKISFKFTFKSRICPIICSLCSSTVSRWCQPSSQFLPHFRPLVGLDSSCSWHSCSSTNNSYFICSFASIGSQAFGFHLGTERQEKLKFLNHFI